jgi:hypothetical protein
MRASFFLWLDQSLTLCVAVVQIPIDIRVGITDAQARQVVDGLKVCFDWSILGIAAYQGTGSLYSRDLHKEGRGHMTFQAGS